MQTSKLRPLYSLTSLGNVIARTTATHTPIVNSAQQTKSWKEIPGPSLWDLMKQALPGASGDLNLTDGLKLGQALYDHYGPIVKLDGFLGRPPIILLYDPEQCAQVLRSENWLPIRSGFQSLDYYRRNKRNKGNENQSNPDMTGLLTDHGETWKKFRSTVNPVLLQPKTIKLYTSIIDEVAQDMIVRYLLFFLKNIHHLKIIKVPTLLAARKRGIDG
ncbi:hypothetical protein evm_013704 [Chilo suppressalis]|nr:hypothetical protein evm_013704 [Chilo suppressalis]